MWLLCFYFPFFHFMVKPFHVLCVMTVRSLNSSHGNHNTINNVSCPHLWCWKMRSESMAQSRVKQSGWASFHSRYPSAEKSVWTTIPMQNNSDERSQCLVYTTIRKLIENGVDNFLFPMQPFLTRGGIERERSDCGILS